MLYDNAPRLPEGDVIVPRDLVGGAEHVELEIGPGRGWFMVERLTAVPEIGMVGLEIRRKWATIVDDRLRARGFAARGRVFAEDAREALPRFQAGSFRIAYLHFPDPWWKKRHHKRRVLSSALLDELARVITPGGELFLQTDVDDRADSFEELLAGHAAFVAWSGPGTSPRIDDNPYQARSPRERRALVDGLPVTRLRYRRI